MEDAWETGVRYRLDRDGDDLVDEFERAVAVIGRKRTMNRKSLIDHMPGISDLFEASGDAESGRRARQRRAA